MVPKLRIKGEREKQKGGGSMLEEKTMVSSGYWLELLAAGRSCLLIIRTAQPRHGEREQGTDRPTEQATTSFKVGEKYHEHNSE